MRARAAILAGKPSRRAQTLKFVAVEQLANQSSHGRSLHACKPHHQAFVITRWPGIVDTRNGCRIILQLFRLRPIAVEEPKC